MSNLKCPFCGQELEYGGTYTDGTRKLWCDSCHLFGDSKLFSELIRTRKALGIAIERLEQIAHESFQGDQQSINIGFHIRAAAALTDIEQITALEQKD